MKLRILLLLLLAAMCFGATGPARPREGNNLAPARLTEEQIIGLKVDILAKAIAQKRWPKLDQNREWGWMVRPKERRKKGSPWIRCFISTGVNHPTKWPISVTHGCYPNGASLLHSAATATHCVN